MTRANRNRGFTGAHEPRDRQSERGGDPFHVTSLGKVGEHERQWS